MGRLLVANSNNIFTYAFNASAKTISISNNTVYDLQYPDLLSVYNVTRSAFFNFENTSPSNFARTTDTNGLPVYTWTFDQIPAASANADVLNILITCPDQFLDYTALLKIAGATI